MRAPIDLRSDTVTRPSPGMRAAMNTAEVGDDVYREDPTTRRLEERVAEIVGKQAALFVPSGTMSNQIALLCHTRRGDEIVVGEGTHCAFYESGAAPAWSGVQFATAGTGGLFTASELEAVIKPTDYWCPRTSLVVLENTHNRAGGRVFPSGEIEAIARVARARSLKLHLDGARVWNASVATGESVAKLAEAFDTVSVCFSKGLGAPVGSALVGPTDLIVEALRFRKMLGGGMRQVGILAAAALYALEHQRDRLAEDHEAARRIGDALAGMPGVRVAPIETNIVNVDVPGVPAARVVAEALSRGVVIGASAPGRIRIVTHLDLARADVPVAADALREALVAAREATS